MACTETGDSNLVATISDYLTWHVLRGSSARHKTDMRQMLSAFAKSAGAERPPAEISRPACEKFLKVFQERAVGRTLARPATGYCTPSSDCSCKRSVLRTRR